MTHTRIAMVNLLKSAATVLALGGCVAGCSNLPKPGVATRIRTIASVGDKTLPVVAGAPGDAIVADREGPGPRPGEAGGVSGRVVDKQGQPIPNAEVRLAVGGTKRGRAVKAVTDESGAFTLHGLRRGVAYTVIAERADGADVLSGRAPVQAPEHDVRIVLRPDDDGGTGADGHGDGDGERDTPRNADPDPDAPPGRVHHASEGQDDAGEPEDRQSRRRPVRINAEDIPPAEDAEDITPPDSEEPPAARSKPRAPAAPPASGWRRGSTADNRRASQLPPSEPDSEPASEPVAEVVPLPRASPETKPDADRPAPPELDRTLATASSRPEPEPTPQPAPKPSSPAADPLAVAPELASPPPAPPAPSEAPVLADLVTPPASEPTPPPAAAPAAETSEKATPAESSAKSAEATTAPRDPLPPLDEPGTKPPAVADKPVPADSPGKGPPADAIAPTVSTPAPALPEATGPEAAGPAVPPQPAEGAAATASTPKPAVEPVSPPGPADAPTKQEDAPASAGVVDGTSAPEGIPAPRRHVTWGQLPPPTAPRLAAAEPRRTRPGKLGRSPARSKQKAEPDVPPTADGEPAACQFDSRRQQLLDFRLPDLQGRTVRFQDLNADLVLLDFWGTWCNPCLQSVPHLIDLQQRLGGSGLKVLGIAYEQLGTTAERVAAVGDSARKLGINYQVLLGDIETCPLQAAFHVQAYPTMILLDRQGRILWRDQGSSAGTLARLDRVIDAQARAAVARR